MYPAWKSPPEHDATIRLSLALSVRDFLTIQLFHSTDPALRRTLRPVAPALCHSASRMAGTSSRSSRVRPRRRVCAYSWTSGEMVGEKSLNQGVVGLRFLTILDFRHRSCTRLGNDLPSTLPLSVCLYRSPFASCVGDKFIARPCQGRTLRPVVRGLIRPPTLDRSQTVPVEPGKAWPKSLLSYDHHRRICGRSKLKSGGPGP